MQKMNTVATKQDVSIEATDICYIISHGFAARMLLQTNLLLRLTETGKHVAIITPDAADANLQALLPNDRIRIYDAGIKQTIWDDDYGVKRMYYLEDIKSNPVFWEKHINGIWYTKSIHPWKRIRPFIYYPIHLLIPHFPSIRKRFKKTEGKYLVSQKATALLKKIRPRLVVSTYPINFLEAKFLYAAKQLQIQTLIHLLSWDNITSKGIFPVIPDRFIAWGEVMQKELKEYYQVNDDSIYVCGVPHFDNHIRVKKNPAYRAIIKELGLSPDSPYLFVAMSSPRFAPHEIDIVEWLAAAVRNNKFGDSLQLVIRPHPQNMQGSMADKHWIPRLDKLIGSRVAIDYPRLVNSKVRWSMQQSDMNRLSNLLAGCSICFNSGSTVSIDALMFDKPVILTAFDADKQLNYWKSARRVVDFPHQKKFVEMGGASVVYSFEELTQQIHAYLKNPKLDQAKRQYAIDKECYKNDGYSTNRVIEALCNILR